MSPIVGLTDRNRLDRLGKIRLGIKVTNAAGVEYPKAVDYFVVPPEVQAVYGEKPTALDVLMPGNDIDKVTSVFYRAYSQTRGNVCKGDGEWASRTIDSSSKTTLEDGTEFGTIARRDAKTVERIKMRCPGKECADYQAGDCREMMSFQFIIPTVQGLGVYQLDSNSINSILNVTGTLSMLETGLGHVAMVPLMLELKPQEITSPEDGRRKTIHTIHLTTKGSFAQLQAAGLQQVGPTGDPGILPEPDDEEAPDTLYPSPEAVAARAEDESALVAEVKKYGTVVGTVLRLEGAGKPPDLFDEEPALFNPEEEGKNKRARMKPQLLDDFIAATDQLGWVDSPTSNGYRDGKSRSDYLNNTYGKGWGAMTLTEQADAVNAVQQLTAAKKGEVVES